MSDFLKILWLKSGPLYPVDTGGKIRTHAMLGEISQQHQITYLAFRDMQRELHPDEESAGYAREKIWIPWQEAKAGSLSFFRELLLNLFSPLPYALAKYRSKAMQEQILQLDQSDRFDLIICDFLVPAPNVHSIHSQLKTPTILFQHNIESEIWRRLAKTKTGPLSKFYFHLQYRRMFRWEQKLSRIFSGIITVSPNDSEFCRDHYQLDKVLGEVPTGVDVNYFHPIQDATSQPIQPSTPDCGTTARQASSHRIAFLGSMDWMPNIECVQYFTAQVLPLILEKMPAVRFVVIGRNPTPAVQKLVDQHPALELTGSVDDIRPHLQACSLMVVPLRAGGGTRIKIFEAMAMGIPVVSTTIGAEGLPVIHGEDILIGDSDQALADACLQLLNEPGLVQKITAAARKKVEQDHSWQAVSEQFINLCRTAIKV